MFLDANKSFNVYSSTGKLGQCDNALAAALNASLCVGCTTSLSEEENNSNDGVVLVSYKKTSKLVNKQAFHKVFNICPTIGVTYSGLQPDFRAQLETAQRLCFEYKEVYGVWPSIETFMNEFSNELIQTSNKGGIRPFGTYLLFAGIGKNNTPMLFYLDPSCSFGTLEVAASGENYEGARSFIQRRRGSLDDNIQTCLNALREHVGIEIKAEDVSVGVLTRKSSNEEKSQFISGEDVAFEFKVYTEEQKEELFF